MLEIDNSLTSFRIETNLRKTYETTRCGILLIELSPPMLSTKQLKLFLFNEQVLDGELEGIF